MSWYPLTDNDIQNKTEFSIDDAFSESSEDKIRLYSNSSETAPLTETIYEEQEPPDFEGSSLALSPTQSSEGGDSSEPPIIRTKPILKNPTLTALKAREDKDVREYRCHCVTDLKSNYNCLQSTSQDSVSLIQNNPGYYAGSEPNKFWWKHPKIKENWKTVTAALVLVVLGVGKE